MHVRDRASAYSRVLCGRRVSTEQTLKQTLKGRSIASTGTGMDTRRAHLSQSFQLSMQLSTRWLLRSPCLLPNRIIRATHHTSCTYSHTPLR